MTNQPGTTLPEPPLCVAGPDLCTSGILSCDANGANVNGKANLNQTAVYNVDVLNIPVNSVLVISSGAILIANKINSNSVLSIDNGTIIVNKQLTLSENNTFIVNLNSDPQQVITVADSACAQINGTLRVKNLVKTTRLIKSKCVTGSFTTVQLGRKVCQNLVRNDSLGLLLSFEGATCSGINLLISWLFVLLLCFV